MNFAIDMVYLWVDGSDPVWQAKRNAAIGITTADSATNCDGRYANNDELRYSLRSLEMYAPWIRRIFIVTDSQVPDWLDTSNPRIRIVDHTEILPADALPTFNSVVIEHAMWRIPGLADHFLYANDDMMFNRPVSPNDFFTADGRPIARLNRRPLRKFTLWLRAKLLGRPISNYNLTIQNAARLVENRYGRYFGSKTHHNIDAYTVGSLRHTFETFQEEIEPTLANHQRSDHDIQRNIYTYVAIAEGEAVAEYVDRRTSFHMHIDNPRHFDKIECLHPMLFCMNDSQYATDDDRQRVASYLRHRFPEPSSFELSGK